MESVNAPQPGDTIQYQGASSPFAVDMVICTAFQTSLSAESTKTRPTVPSLGTMIG
jgi:hypothetical protein